MDAVTLRSEAVMRKGIVNDYYEAFQKYLRDGAPAYERKIHVSPQSALKIIGDAGGLSIYDRNSKSPGDSVYYHAAARFLHIHNGCHGRD